MTLAGLVKHLAYVEDGWFHENFAGNEVPEPWDRVDWSATTPDWEWHSAVDDDPATLLQIWHASVARSRAAVAAAESMEHRRNRRPGGRPVLVAVDRLSHDRGVRPSQRAR